MLKKKLILKKLIKKFDARYVALVWDSKGKTTRHEMFQDYKATRQAAPSDIFDQKDLIVEFADLIGMKQLAAAVLKMTRRRN